MPSHSLSEIKHTLDDNLRHAAAAYPDKTALVFYGTRISYAALNADVTALAAYLQKTCGVRQGDRVGLFMQNAPQFVVGFYAVIRAGGVVVPINAMNQTDELTYLARDADFETVLTAQDVASFCTPLLQGGTLRHLVVADYRDALQDVPQALLPDFLQPGQAVLPDGAVLWADALASGQTLDAVPLAPTDLCALPYTSGTSGHPRGCMHSHVSTLSAVRCVTQWFGLTSSDVFLAAAPMFHVVGMQAGMNAAIAVGGTSVILPRWDRDVAAQLIHDFGVTAWPTVPTAVIDFLARPDLVRDDLASLRHLWGGGSAMPEAIAQKLYAMTGLRFAECYGMTETMAPATNNPEDRPKDQCGGLPSLGTDIKIVDPDTLADVPQGEVGEILICGPQVMQGYWQQPEATSKALVALNGQTYLRSGDLGRHDEDGYLFIVDRLKRMINASGFKVWPSEVEARLYAHPAIKEACVISAKDPYRGETVKAVVVLKDGTTLDADGLKAWAQDKMAAYKIPKLIELVDALPKSGSGKVLWRVLQDQQDARDSGR